MRPVTLDEYLAIVAAVLGIDAAQAVRITNLSLADSALHAPFASYGGVEFYPAPHQKAAILCSRLVRNHPVTIDGNKRAGYLSMLVFLEVNGLVWKPPSDDEIELTINAVAAGTMAEDTFVEWVAEHTEPGPPVRLRAAE